MTHDNAAFQDTDDAEVITVLAAVRHCANSWVGGARLVGNVRAADISRACNAAIKSLSATNVDGEVKDKIKQELGHFHRNSCYPEAMDGEKQVTTDRILAITNAERMEIIEKCAALADRLQQNDPDARKNYGKAIRALLADGGNG